jgi:hypothetical protein
MDITKEMEQQILDHVIQHYFTNARVESLVLAYLGKNSFARKYTTTENICQYLEQEGIATSRGAVRGTILRIRHKLFKYKGQDKQQAFQIVLPEPTSRQGYLLQFEKNLHYRVNKDFASHDPWLAMNWKALRTQGYQGFWCGFSLPDGGRWPVKLFALITALRDEQKEEEKFMCLLNSPSSTKRRIGILQGEVKNLILCLEGKWSVHYSEEGLKHFLLTAHLWPFRTNQSDPVKISGRFTLYDEANNEYQEGQIELDFCYSQALKIKDFGLL